MTILEALNAEVGNITLSNKFLVLRGLNPTDTFSLDNSSEVEIAKAFCFRAMVNQPDFSEDGLSITFSRADLIREANRIFAANDLTDEIIEVVPKIESKTNLW